MSPPGLTEASEDSAEVVDVERVDTGPPGMMVADEVMVLPAESVFVVITVRASEVEMELGMAVVELAVSNVSVGFRATPTIEEKGSFEDLLMTMPPEVMANRSVL